MCLRIICPDLWVRREKLSSMREIDVFSLQMSLVYRFPETSRLIPNISDEFPKTSESYRNLNVRRCSGKRWSTSEAA